MKTFDTNVLQWMMAKNASSSEDIPPYAAVMIDSLDEEENLLIVKKPDIDGASTVFFASKAGIKAGSIGRVTCQLPLRARYTIADGPPTSAMTWGTKAGQYELAKDKGSLRWWWPIDATAGIGAFGNSVNAGLGECVTIEVVTHATVACVEGEPVLTLTKATINRINCTP